MKTLFLVVMALCLNFTGKACDACGCSGSIGNMGLGIQSQGNRSSFSIVHSFKVFHTQIPGLYGNPDTRSMEYYNRTDLTGTIRLSKHFQARAVIPYIYNSQVKEPSARSAQNGIGDVQVGMNYYIIDSAYSMNELARWSVGFTSKLPTGYFESPEREQLMLNPGSGTFDYSLVSSLMIRFRKIGISNESSYTLRTTNKYNYNPGNTWYNQTIGMYIFNRFTFGTGISFASNAQAKFNGEDYDHTNTQAILVQSASVASFASESWNFQVGFNLPVYQLLGEGNSTLRGAISFGAYHIINKKQSRESSSGAKRKI